MRRVLSAFQTDPVFLPMLLLLALVWILPHTPLVELVEREVQRKYQQLPSVKIDLHPHRTWLNRFSHNKTALYIETRPDISHATPLLLHMMQVVPPEWRFVFLGSDEIVTKINRSKPVQRMQDTGKLRLGSIESWTETWTKQVDIQETYNRLLTNPIFYRNEFPEVEWLLVFRSSSIICANSNRTVNDYLDYDWVGAPWSLDDHFGGNGGLSLRRLSKVHQVLQFQTRVDDTESEDRWLSHRIGLLPGANNANASVEAGFSVEDIWADEPLGYYINPGLNPDSSPGVWARLSKRRQVYNYCPEVKILFPNMRLERERCIPLPEEDNSQ